MAILKWSSLALLYIARSSGRDFVQCTVPRGSDAGDADHVTTRRWLTATGQPPNTNRSSAGAKRVTINADIVFLKTSQKSFAIDPGENQSAVCTQTINWKLKIRHHSNQYSLIVIELLLASFEAQRGQSKGHVRNSRQREAMTSLFTFLRCRV